MMAILCETPFQLICGLNLVYSQFHDECVLYLREDMYNTTNKFHIGCTDNTFIKKTHYICSVSLITTILRKLPLPRIFKKKILIKYIPTASFSEKIDAIVVTKFNEAMLSLIHSMLAPDAKIYLIEEGIGEYYTFRKYEPHLKLRNYVQGRYLMAPSLYKLESIYQNYQSPSLSKDEAFIHTINKVLQYDGYFTIPKYLYFGQPCSDDIDEIEFGKREHEILSEIINIVGSSEMAYKPHPRENKNISVNLKTIPSSPSWECLMINESDIKNKVIISISSTALITPKLLLNEEPYVICLHVLFKDQSINHLSKFDAYNSVLSIMNGVKELYSDKDKFIIPSSIEELKSNLYRISENINRECIE